MAVKITVVLRQRQDLVSHRFQLLPGVRAVQNRSSSRSLQVGSPRSARAPGPLPPRNPSPGAAAAQGRLHGVGHGRDEEHGESVNGGGGEHCRRYGADRDAEAGEALVWCLRAVGGGRWGSGSAPPGSGGTATVAPGAVACGASVKRGRGSGRSSKSASRSGRVRAPSRAVTRSPYSSMSSRPSRLCSVSASRVWSRSSWLMRSWASLGVPGLVHTRNPIRGGSDAAPAMVVHSLGSTLSTKSRRLGSMSARSTPPKSTFHRKVSTP